MFRRQQQHTIPHTAHQFAFQRDIPPVLRVKPGATVRFETSPEPAERLFAAQEQGGNLGWMRASDTSRINAITGPLAIDGARPGDALRVEILEITTLEWGWCSAMPGFGLLANNVREPFLGRIPIKDGVVWLTEALQVPLRPMVGCFGVAPASGTTSALAPPMPWGGNYDLLQARPGATIWLPVQVESALLSLGDLHAAMGDGEATSISIECAGSITVRVDIERDTTLQMPRLLVDERLTTVGLAERGEWGSARRHASDQMFNYLTEERGLTEQDAFLYISAVGDLTFGGPAGAVACMTVPLAPLDARERYRPGTNVTRGSR